MVSVCLCTGSTSTESFGQGEEGGVTHTLLCTWWQLGLSVKRSWLRSGGPILGFKKIRASFGGGGREPVTSPCQNLVPLGTCEHCTRCETKTRDDPYSRLLTVNFSPSWHSERLEEIRQSITLWWHVMYTHLQMVCLVAQQWFLLVLWHLIGRWSPPLLNMLGPAQKNVSTKIRQ